jgi:hypothetical protein
MVKDERESGKLVVNECNSQSGERKWGRVGEKASQSSAKCLRKRVPFHHDRLLKNKKVYRRLNKKIYDLPKEQVGKI